MGLKRGIGEGEGGEGLGEGKRIKGGRDKHDSSGAHLWVRGEEERRGRGLEHMCLCGCTVMDLW